MSYRSVDNFQAGAGWNWKPVSSWSCWKAVYRPVWPIPLEFHPDPVRKLSSNLYDIYHWSSILVLLESCLQTCMTYTTGVPSWSCSKAVYKPVWHIPLLSVQWMNSWWRTEELPETCRVSCQNKYVKLVHLVGFIIKQTFLLRPYDYLVWLFNLVYMILNIGTTHKTHKEVISFFSTLMESKSYRTS